MALNFKDWQKKSGDKHFTTIKHTSGSEIKIAHHALSPEHMQELEAMPHYDEGGAIEDAPMDPASYPVAPNIPAAPSNPADSPAPALQGMSANLTDLGQNVAPAWQAPKIATDTSSPTIATTTPHGATPTPSPMDAGKAEQIGGALGAAAAEGNLGKQQAGILAQAQKQQQEAANHYQQSANAIDAERQAVQQDLKEGHIDPKRYWNSQTDVGKMSTAIGLILGGIGSGLQGGPNHAVEFLNKAIDRDVEAQKSDMANKHNLLSSLTQQFGNVTTAANMLRTIHADTVVNQLQQAAAKATDPKAAAAAMSAIGQIKAQYAPYEQQAKVQAAAMSQAKSGGTADAITMENAGLIPKGEGSKEQKSIDAQKVAADTTRNLYADLDKEQSAGNLLNPQSYKRVAAKNAELVNAVMNASASKRLTKESVEQEIAPLEIKTGDTEETRKAKLEGVLNIIKRHADPTPHMTRLGLVPDFYTVPNKIEGAPKRK